MKTEVNVTSKAWIQFDVGLIVKIRVNEEVLRLMLKVVKWQFTNFE